MSDVTDKHFGELAKMAVPAKRAAYSDRTAWTMALLAELAYMRFDESETSLMSLATELAGLSTNGGGNVEEIRARLKEFAKTLAEIGKDGGGPGAENTLLKAALKAGGFELAGGKPIHEPSTDTQAFVAIRRRDDGTGFAVVCFRGTQQIRDWITNVNAQTQPILDPNPTGNGGEIGSMHKGFHDAYKSVEEAVNQRLAGTEDLPLYITGHSLGGALAVVATWFQSGQRLAVCYTFGAPRMGDSRLQGRFKTPIYRVVNAADPVPFVPPSGATTTALKIVVRFFSTFANIFGLLDRLLDLLIKQQDFRHFGDMKYLPFAKEVNGTYPDLRLQPAISSLGRLGRYIRVFSIPAIDRQLDAVNATNSAKPGKPDRIDKYHDMARYRDKLRAIAIRRNA